MATLILDRDMERRLIARRRRLGLDLHDEVWEGVYVMAPVADNEHQRLAGDLYSVIEAVLRQQDLGWAFPAVNISDRRKGWRKNYRVPDVAVFLNGNAAEDCGTFWHGGPDLAIEIVSPRDRTRKKLPFYEKIGTRELLVIDRRPWRLVLYRLLDARLVEVSSQTIGDEESVRSAVVPLSFRLCPAGDPPEIELVHHDGAQRWLVQIPARRQTNR